MKMHLFSYLTCMALGSKLSCIKRTLNLIGLPFKLEAISVQSKRHIKVRILQKQCNTVECHRFANLYLVLQHVLSYLAINSLELQAVLNHLDWAKKNEKGLKIRPPFFSLFLGFHGSEPYTSRGKVGSEGSLLQRP